MNNKVPYLNLGCGLHYHKDWVNLDFVSTGENVIAHNLLNGIPYPDNTFSVVYHSHVLEHFPKKEAKKFITECFRVLKKDGILRIVIPDLECIINEYEQLLSQLKSNPDDPYLNACYDWILLELYDQTVRNYGGGSMGEYLGHDLLINEDFVLRRCGYEVKSLRNYLMSLKAGNRNEISNVTKKSKNYLKEICLFIRNFRPTLKMRIVKRLLGPEYKFYEIGKFRSQGEIHQWMYDRHSLTRMLLETGFRNVQVCKHFESKIPDWEKYLLDSMNGDIRKPDSLFIETIK